MVLLIRMHSDRTFDDEDWNADLQVLSAFAPWHRNRRKRFFRLGCLQDSEHYRRVAKAARRCRAMLAMRDRQRRKSRSSSCLGNIVLLMQRS